MATSTPVQTPCRAPAHSSERFRPPIREDREAAVDVLRADGQTVAADAPEGWSSAAG